MSELCRRHAQGDLQFMHPRPASGQVSQQIKVENLARCLQRYFDSDLRTLQNGAEGTFNRLLACDIHTTVTTSPECPGQDTCGYAHFRVPGRVEQELDLLLNVCSDIIRQRNSLTLAEKFQAGAFFLGRFLSIGVFSNGNGRTGRLLASVLLMRLGAAEVPLRFDLPRESGNRFAKALKVAKTRLTECRGDWREAMASETLRKLVEFMRDAENSARRLHNPAGAADNET